MTKRVEHILKVSIREFKGQAEEDLFSIVVKNH